MLVLILLTDIDPHLLQEESKTCPRDPIPVIPRWYRFERYDGTNSNATVVPIQALRWYRFADIIK